MIDPYTHTDRYRIVELPGLIGLREQADRIIQQLAATEYTTAARIVRHNLPDATELLFAEHEDINGSIETVPLVALNGDEIVWYNDDDLRYDSCDYPGAENLRGADGGSLVMIRGEDLTHLTEHLTRGYEAYLAGGGGGDAVEPIVDEYFGNDDVNVLVLNLADALKQ